MLKIFQYYLSFFSCVLGEHKLAKCNNFLSFSITSANPVRKDPLIIESLACILQVTVVIFLLPTIFLISFGLYSTSKLSSSVARFF